MSDSFVTPWTVDCQAPLSIEFPSNNTGESCHFLLQGIFLIQESNPLAGGLFICFMHSSECLGFPGGLDGKEPTCNDSWATVHGGHGQTQLRDERSHFLFSVNVCQPQPPNPSHHQPFPPLGLHMSVLSIYVPLSALKITSMLLIF